MNMISWRLLLLLCGLIALFPGLAQSQALQLSSLFGSYGFRFSATIVPGSGNFAAIATSAPFAGSGVFTAGGNGIITAGSITYNYNGIVCSTTITPAPQLAESIYTVDPDGETAIRLVTATNSDTCGITSLFFAGALDNIDPGRPAQHVQLANTAVVAIRLGTVGFSAPTDIAVVGAGEARFQQPTVVRPLPCLTFGRC